MATYFGSVAEKRKTLERRRPPAHSRPKTGAARTGTAAPSDSLWLESLRAELLAHPHVDDAALRWQSDITGPRLKAFVRPRPHAPEGLQRSLLSWLRHHMPGGAIPETFVLCRRLPTDTMLDDVA